MTDRVLSRLAAAPVALLLLAAAGCVRAGFGLAPHDDTGRDARRDAPEDDGRAERPTDAMPATLDGARDLFRAQDLRPVPLVQVFAGTGVAGFKDGPVLQAQFNWPGGLALEGPGGALLVTDWNGNRVRRIVGGVVSTVAGTGVAGMLDGPALSGQLNGPHGLALDLGDLLIADYGNCRVRRLASGQLSTLAGAGCCYQDGPAATALFWGPHALAVDAAGAAYVVEYSGFRVRRIAGGQVTTFAGTGQAGFKDGPAAQATFNGPSHLCWDATRTTLYVTERPSHRVRAIAGGQVTTLAGTGTAGSVDGPVATAQLNGPSGIVLDPAGRLFVAEYDGGTIRMIVNGVVSTLVTGLTYPEAMVVDGQGTLYVVEEQAHRIKVVHY